MKNLPGVRPATWDMPRRRRGALLHIKLKDDVRIKVADELLVLEKGPEELLLANSIDFRPLYIRKGREYIREFLKTVGELACYKTIAKAYSQERNLLNLLLEYRIVVPRESAGQDKRMGSSSRRLQSGRKKSLSLYLLLSQSCNLRCIYCLDGARTYQTDQCLRMSKEIAFKSIEHCLDDIEDGGLLEVIFFGGEPLLNWPLAKAVIAHCEKCLREQHTGKRRQYHFTSNLSFLPTDLMEWAKKFNILVPVRH